MEYVADFHLHSKYSRAVSSQMVLPTMAAFAKQKGIDIVSATDFTHPLWFKEMKGQVVEASDGLYKLKTQSANFKTTTQNSNLNKEILFILSTEIASIYSEKGKLRRIHNLVFAPDLETVEKINQALLKRGANLHSDGRPIIGISSKNLLSLLLEIDERIMLIPCHVWTPHFGMYGSASGYDSLEEAFEDLTPYIYGIETGLSSDPEMNWQIKELENRSILSFSDAHSPAKMGREATVFELGEASYENIRKAIMFKNVIARSPEAPKQSQKILKQVQDDNRIIYTIEFYPEEGKYHFSGHRNCGVVFGPEEIKTQGVICPVCKKRLTEGVLLRIQNLSSGQSDGQWIKAIDKKNAQNLKWYVDPAKKHPPFVKLVPLLEVVAESMDSTVASQKVKDMFVSLCEAFGSEIEVLIKTPIEEIAKTAGPKIAEGVEKVREGNIAIAPGYDGEYGKVKIWNKDEHLLVKEGERKDQLGLF